jgi:hypothetical protein
MADKKLIQRNYLRNHPKNTISSADNALTSIPYPLYINQPL